MYIKDIITKAKPSVSFEIFPPKPNTPVENVLGAAAELCAARPDFMSVTYGAAGTSRENTIAIASHVQNKLGTTALAHLTCVMSTREQVRGVLDELKSENISNILALRGDFPADGGFDKSAMELAHASDLIREIKSYGGFCIGGACYPEGHIENSSVENDMENLKFKVDCGLDFLVSQLFFDNNMFYSFLYRAAGKGIDIPVCAGIMPVTNRNQVKRMCLLSGATLTSKFKAMLDRFYDKPEALKQAGIAYATEQIIDLLSNGVTDIHIYTMNKPEIANKIMENIKDIIA